MKKLQIRDIVAIIFFILVESILLFDNITSLTLWQNKMLQYAVTFAVVFGHFMVFVLVKKRELTKVMLTYWILSCFYNITSLLWVYLRSPFNMPFAITKRLFNRSLAYFLPTVSTIISKRSINSYFLNDNVPISTVALHIMAYTFIILYVIKLKRKK